MRQRLGLADTDRPALIDHVPELLDQIAAELDGAPGAAHDLARLHGIQRGELGMQPAQVVRELGHLHQVILHVADADGVRLGLAEHEALTAIMSRAAASSVDAYVATRERDLEAQALRHFSFVAHELRSPLQSARLALDLVATGSNPERALERVSRSLKELSRRVDDALVAYRLRDGSEKTRELVSLGDAVRDAVDEFSMQAERRGVRVQSEVENLALEIDPRVLHSVLTNLIGNAVRLTRSEGRVKVDVRLQSGQVRITVQDQCGGLKVADPERLFDTGIRATRDRDGFGLGLALVRQAVEAQGGTVTVQNDPPQGCTFTVSLPLRSVGSDRANG